MLLNTTIHALIASTQAIAAHVIAGLFVRFASPAIFAVVPQQTGSMRDLRWRYLYGHPAGDSKQEDSPSTVSVAPFRDCSKTGSEPCIKARVVSLVAAIEVKGPSARVLRTHLNFFRSNRERWNAHGVHWLFLA